MLDRILQREGYQVQTSTDPEDGLNLLKQQPYDLLVTDLNMPGMTGLDSRPRQLHRIAGA